MSNDDDHFTLGDFLFALEFVCPALLALFLWAGFLGLAPAALRPFSSCCFFFLGFCRLKTESWITSPCAFCQQSLWIHFRKEIKAEKMMLTCSLGFLLGVAIGTSCGISSSSSSSSTFFSPSPRDSVWLVTSSLFFVLASVAWEQTSGWFVALKQWLLLSWVRKIPKPSWSHFVLGRFCFFCRLLQQFEVAQIGRVNGEGDRWLALHVDDLDGWFLL